MSKNLSWAANRRLIEERHKVTENYEQELRDQIADEILAEGPWCNNHSNPGKPNDCPCYIFAASIARGQK